MLTHSFADYAPPQTTHAAQYHGKGSPNGTQPVLQQSYYLLLQGMLGTCVLVGTSVLPCWHACLLPLIMGESVALGACTQLGLIDQAGS